MALKAHLYLNSTTFGFKLEEILQFCSEEGASAGTRQVIRKYVKPMQWLHLDVLS